MNDILEELSKGLWKNRDVISIEIKMHLIELLYHYVNGIELHVLFILSN
jgi:hypothetical protein